MRSQTQRSGKRITARPARLNPTLNLRTRHPAIQTPADRRESGVCESLGELARTGNRLWNRKKVMQRCNNSKCQKKIRPLLPDFSAISAIPAKTRPAMSELVQLSYNARKQSSGLAGAGEAPITAHHMNHKNCSSDMQTLVNARNLSSTLIRDNQRQPGPNCSESPKSHKITVQTTALKLTVNIDRK